MGVKGLGKLIRLKARPCISYKNFQDYRNTSQALDASLDIYKFGIAMIENDNTHKKNLEISHIFGIFFKSCALLRYGIMPIWVFDGKPPAIKNITLDERRSQKYKAHIKLLSQNLTDTERSKLEKKTFTLSEKKINEAKKILDYMGVSYVQAPEEAEAQGAALNKINHVYGFGTEDWDALLFGCKKMLRDFSNKKKIMEINRDKLLECLHMTKDQLIDLCIIMGTDYCPCIKGLNPITAYEKFKKVNFNIHNFIENLKSEKKYIIPENFLELWSQAKKYYLNALVVDPAEIKIKWSTPNYEKLIEFLIKEKNMDEQKILKKIAELKLLFDYYIKQGKLITLSRIKYMTNQK